MDKWRSADSCDHAININIRQCRRDGTIEAEKGSAPNGDIARETEILRLEDLIGRGVV